MGATVSVPQGNHSEQQQQQRHQSQQQQQQKRKDTDASLSFSSPLLKRQASVSSSLLPKYILTNLRTIHCDDGSNASPPPLPPPPPGTDDVAATIKEADKSVSSSEPLPTSIPNPGPYEQCIMDCKRLVNVDTFDGMRLDISKPLSPYFLVMHSFWLGTSSLPDGRSSNYTCLAQVGDDTGSLYMARAANMHNPFSLDGRVHLPLLGGLALAKIQFSASQQQSEGQQLQQQPQQNNDQCLAEIDFGGPTWTANLKYGTMHGSNVFGFNYLQSITPNFVLGGEGIFLCQQAVGLSNYTLKYTFPPGDAPTATASKEDEKEEKQKKQQPTLLLSDAPSSTICANLNFAQDALILNYKRNVTPNRVALGAELACSLSDPIMGSQCSAGAEFRLNKSKIHVGIDSMGRVQSNVEAKLGMHPGSPSVQFSAELDHWNDQMKFGYGIQIEG